MRKRMKVGFNMNISRQFVIKVLAQHGWKTDSLTFWNPNTSDWVKGTTFDLEMGIHETYDLDEVKAWLGY